MSDGNDESGDSSRAVPDGFDSWNAYWTAQGMPWRTQPEISDERRTDLAERLSRPVDDVQHVYPLSGERLSRRDIEWLLTYHLGGKLLTNWRDTSEAEVKRGLDLRGADLSDADLHRLMLPELRAGLDAERYATDIQGRELAATRFTNANLSRTLLQAATLRFAHLENSNLQYAHFEGATLRGAQLQGADLRYAFFDRGTALNDATFGDAKCGYVRVADTRWGDVNLSVVNWPVVKVLGDEQEARRRKDADGNRKHRSVRRSQYEEAVRANRQLAIALRSQGLNEHADRFAYRAQVLQRQVLRRQRRYGAALGSWLLDAIAGYGYKPVRSVATYLLVILSFAAAYFALTNFALTLFLPSHSSPLAWYEALVLSVSSFHGRGLFPTGLSLGDPIAILAAFEAIIGLLIEITYIATFTQRFFAR